MYNTSRVGEVLPGRGQNKSHPAAVPLCSRCEFSDIAGNAYPCGYCFNPFGDMFIKKKRVFQSGEIEYYGGP